MLSDKSKVFPLSYYGVIVSAAQLNFFGIHLLKEKNVSSLCAKKNSNSIYISPCC